MTTVPQEPAPSDNVVDIAARKEPWTPEDAIAVASRREWDDVVICGLHDDDVVVLASNVSRERMLWIAEHLKRYVLEN